MRKIAGYLTKNRSEKDQKIAQSTHENEHIKPRKTFWRNSKQLLNLTPDEVICTERRRKDQQPFKSSEYDKVQFLKIIFWGL